MGSFRRDNAFLITFAITCVSLLMMMVVINAVVDSYQIMPSSLSLMPRGHPAKAVPGSTSFRLIKAADVMKIKPKAILLGTSRVEQGFRAQDAAALLDMDCYNLGLDGAGFFETYAYFQHALFHQPDLRYVIIGLDLFCFNKNRPPRPDFSRDRLGRIGLPWGDYFHALLSQESCLASLSSLTNLYNWCLSKEIAKHGVLDDRGNITEESRIAFFLNQGLTGEGDDYLVMEKLFSSSRLYGNFEFSEDAFTLFKKMVCTCRERGIQLKVYFSPSRVLYWYGLRLKGLGESLRRLKTEVAQLIDVWDFSGVNEVTLEESNYFDFSHFRSKIGKQLLPVLLGLEEPKIGRKLTAANVEAELDRWDQELTEWAMLDLQNASFVRNCIATSGKK